MGLGIGWGGVGWSWGDGEGGHTDLCEEVCLPDLEVSLLFSSGLGVLGGQGWGVTSSSFQGHRLALYLLTHSWAGGCHWRVMAVN